MSYSILVEIIIGSILVRIISYPSRHHFHSISCAGTFPCSALDGSSTASQRAVVEVGGFTTAWCLTFGLKKNYIGKMRTLT
jgi:hypothetical protein